MSNGPIIKEMAFWYNIPQQTISVDIFICYVTKKFEHSVNDILFYKFFR